MPGENIYDWSTTAANNDTADSLINWQEGMPRAAVNDSSRSVMAALAKARDLQNGSIITGGTANAQTFTSGMAFTAIPTGLRVLVKIGPGLTNTATATLNMDLIAATTIKTQAGGDLVGGELVADAYAEFRYDGTNWILLRSGGSVIGRVVKQVFTSSGTYTPTVGMLYCIIDAVGGGGGGGAVNGAVGWCYGGGGGGGGGYSRKVASAADIGASQVVTIGAGGAAGLSGGAPGGGDGGATSVGSLCIALGGFGGPGQLAGGNSPQSGPGAGTGTGDMVVGGGPGSIGAYLSTTAGIAGGGNGGCSVFGGGGQGRTAGDGGIDPGNVGSTYGGGGSGASVRNSSAGCNARAGADGIAIIIEFVAL